MSLALSKYEQSNLQLHSERITNQNWGKSTAHAACSHAETTLGESSVLCGGQRLEYFGNSAAEAWLLPVFSLVTTKILGTRRELLLYAS